MAGRARTHTGAGRKQQAYDNKEVGFQISNLRSQILGWRKRRRQAHDTRGRNFKSQISNLKSQTGAGARGWHDRLTGAGRDGRQRTALDAVKWALV